MDLPIDIIKIMNIPIDLIKIILVMLPIIDKRDFIRSCKYLNQLFPLMKDFELEFVEMLNNSKFVDVIPIKFNQCEIYTLEYVYYDRTDIPEKYMGDNNKQLFTAYTQLYLSIASKNICKKIYQKYKVHINSIMYGALFALDIEMIKWAQENGFVIEENKFSFPIFVTSILYYIEHIRDTTTDDNTIVTMQNKYSELLKWAKKNDLLQFGNCVCLISLRSTLSLV